MAGKKGAARPPSSSLEVDADEVRDRLAKLTSQDSVPHPTEVQKVDVFSSGLLSLDYALGIGGFARGRFHSIEGPAGSGKTALALCAVGNFQRLHRASVHAVLDVEGTADLDFFKMLGANISPDRLIILRPETAEEACTMAMSLMGYSLQGKLWKQDPKLKRISTITYDSWAGSPTEEVGRAQLARVGSAWIPKISSSATRSGTTIFWINQIREKPDVMFGDPRYAPGGWALKHAQSTKLWVSTTNVEKEDGTKQRIAHDLQIDVQKNKLAPPFRKIFLHLNYKTGFDVIVDCMMFLEKHGADFKESPGGNILTFSYQDEDQNNGQIRANGKKAFLEEIRGNPTAAEAFIAQAYQYTDQNL